MFFSVRTSDNQERKESRQVINTGTDSETFIVQGHYSYIAPDGTPIVLFYVADKDGFRAKGHHLRNSADATVPIIGPPQELPANCIQSLCVNQVG